VRLIFSWRGTCGGLGGLMRVITRTIPAGVGILRANDRNVESLLCEKLSR